MTADTGLTPVPADMPVWVLLLDNSIELMPSVHLSEDSAFRHAAEYCRERWASVADVYGAVAPDDDRECCRLYFELCTNEGAEIAPAEVYP